MYRYENACALITGASSGIGYKFAESFAKRGTHLILVARREDLLNELRENLLKNYSINIHIIPADLSQLGAAQTLYEKVINCGLKVDILVNNAGVGVFGKLAVTDIKKNLDLIMLNVVNLSQLTQLFLANMLSEKKGLIVNIASTASFQPLPYMSNYGASKAFVLSLTEALWAEYRNEGIKFLAVCPGPVETEFFQAMGTKKLKIGIYKKPEEIVEATFSAINKNKLVIIPGISNSAMIFLERFLPRKLISVITERVMRPKKE